MATLRIPPNPRIELRACESPDALARTAAEDWLTFLKTASNQGQPVCIALSGGRIANAFFQAASSAPEANNLAWNSIHFFWADERCVPPESPDSNYAVAALHLFHPLGIPATNIHRLRGEANPETAAAEASAELCRLVPSRSLPGAEEALPVLDLVLLGMGEDGHVASLFPGGPPGPPEAVYLPVLGPKPPPQRLTLNYPVIIQAQQVWVLASGPGKEQALMESLAESGRTPLARVVQSRSHTRIYTDIPCRHGHNKKD